MPRQSRPKDPARAAATVGEPTSGGASIIPGLQSEPGKVSTDEKYRRHEFETYQGWFHWADGWSPQKIREATRMHLRGWPYQSAALARSMAQDAIILGALGQRTAPPLRTKWRVEGPSRAPGRFAVEDLQRVWTEQFRPQYEEYLRDLAIMGGEWIHVHWVLDSQRGVELPRLKRWPWEASIWRAAAPGLPGGWYANTSSDGLVRMVPGDGHWLYMSHGQRSHEMGAVIALGMLFYSDLMGDRDEAGLSEGAGRSALWAELGPGVKVASAEGQHVVDTVAELGLARTGGAGPHGTKVTPISIVSDTSFFKDYLAKHLVKIGLAILGHPGSLAAGAGGVYNPIAMALGVAEALVDKDHEATERAWGQLAKAYEEINANPAGTRLVGERYADKNALAKQVAERAALLAGVVAAQRAAGLVPTQDSVNALADELSTPPLSLTPPPVGEAPPAEGEANPGEQLAAQVANPDKSTAAANPLRALAALIGP